MSEGNPVAKAISETATEIGHVAATTRKRKNWGYIRPEWLKTISEQLNWPNDVIPDDETCIRRIFGVRLDAPVRKSETMLAVWRKEGEPDTEPNLDGTSPQGDTEVGLL